MRRLASAAVLAVAAMGAVLPAHAGALRLCGDTDRLDATQRDRILRLAALVRATLDAADAPVAIVARAGLALDRFGEAYSHAGFALRDGPGGRWAVRQLYFDCQAGRPGLFDQGLPAFLLGAEQPDGNRLSVVLLPQRTAEGLRTAVGDDARALRLLHPHYAANAHAWSVTYQNCNQWVVEMLAEAWSDGSATNADADPRRQAQAWLRQAGYEPAMLDVGSPWLMVAGLFVPWLRRDDHPPDDLDAMRFRVTMPSSIERFVRQRIPQARRIEFCRLGERVVVRDGWTPLPPGCAAGPDDREVALP